MCGERRAKVICFSWKEERLRNMMPVELEQWNFEFAQVLNSIEASLATQGSVTLEFEGIQRQDRSHDCVAVTFDGSLSTSIFNMSDLMSVMDQIGKTVTIISPKKDDTANESSFLEQASSCVGLLGFIKAFTSITYDSGAREFGLGRIIATCLLDVLVKEYAKRMEDLVMEVYKWLKASTRVRKRFDIAVVVLGVASRLVTEQCDLPSEGFWGCLKRQGEQSKPRLEAFGASALPLIDITRLPSESFSEFAANVLPILPNCFEIRIQDARSLKRDRISLGALLVYEAPDFGISAAVSEASLGSTVQPPTLEGYDSEQRASETTPSTESWGTHRYVHSSEYSNENFDEIWNSMVNEG